MCASYMVNYKTFETGWAIIKKRLAILLLSMSPIPQPDENGDVESEYAIDLNSESHI